MNTGFTTIELNLKSDYKSNNNQFNSMKILQKITLLVSLVPILVACDKYEIAPIIPQTGANLTAPAAGVSFVLIEKDTLTKIPFTVNNADFGNQVERTYTLEMDLVGANFANPRVLASSTTNTIEITTKKFNSDLVAKGLTRKVASNAEFRIKSTIKAQNAPLYSSGTTYSVTPY